MTGDEEVLVEVRDPENASGSDSIFLSVVPTEGTYFYSSSSEDGVFYSDFPSSLSKDSSVTMKMMLKIYIMNGQVVLMDCWICNPP